MFPRILHHQQVFVALPRLCLRMLDFRILDDVALFAENEKDLCELTRILDETLNKDLNMEIGVQKTKVPLCRRKHKTKIKIKLRGNQRIEQINELITIDEIRKK